VPEPAPGRPLEEEDTRLCATLIEQLTALEGNVVAVARAMGKHRAQIYKWIHRFGIDVAEFRRER
jgi:transcriptional regulator of acetoin/glycerol metabolism